MIEARLPSSLGATSSDGVEALHHFCFAGYHAVGREPWGALIALNHVTLAPRAALRTEPVDGVELLTIVRKGVIAHAGSLAGGCRTVAGEVQLLSPGPGITHGDINPATRPAEYVEIRLRSEEPRERAQRKAIAFPTRNCLGQFALLASGLAGDRPAMTMNAHARVLGSAIPAHVEIRYPLDPGRRSYVVCLSGCAEVNGVVVDPLGAAAILDEPEIRIGSRDLAEILLIDAL